jgi:polyisoprenoid-binding protein YceI
MNNMKKFTAILAVLTISVVSLSFAQATYVMTNGTELMVSGTSTLHDWEMKSAKGTGQAVITLENGILKGIQSLSVNLTAETLESGKSQMDRNAFKALKTDKNPQIKYVLKDIKSGQGNTWTATGDITIAGVTKTITMPVTVNQQGSVLEFSGSISTKLTEFKIDPPTAMLGTIKTGNDVKLSFSAKFNPSK